MQCDALFRGVSPDLREFVSTWASVLLWWAIAHEMSFYWQEAVHIYQELQKFLQRQPMFTGGTEAPQGAIITQRQRKLPKWIKWASLFPNIASDR